MVNLSTRSLSLCIFMALCLGWGCGEGKILGKKNQGIIVFDVSFPYEQNTLLLELFPREMVMEFKGDLTHSSVKSSYGVVATDFIINHDEKTITQLLKSFSDKYSLQLQGSQVNQWLAQYPPVRIEYTRDTESIAGYHCNKAIAYFESDSLPAIELFYTKDLELDHTNWWNQFNGIDGCLLGYDIEQYGKRMKLRARTVSFEEISNERFKVPTNYQPIDMIGMKNEIDKVVAEFMN